MPPVSRPIEILLVEDSPADRIVAIQALKYAKVLNNVHSVEDGIEALAFLRHEGKYEGVPRPDLILLDLNLPRKDGREVLREIKSDPRLRAIPVVIITISLAEEDVFKAYNEHANCYITKPVDFARFSEIVRGIESFWFEIVSLPPGQILRKAPEFQGLSERRVSKNLLHILLAQDSEKNSVLVTDALARLAESTFQLGVVSTSNEVIERLGKQSFDLILINLSTTSLEGRGGFTAIKAAAQGTPILILNTAADENLDLEALEAGANDYLVEEEMTPRILARSIRHALKRKSLEEQLRVSQKLEPIGQLAGGVAHDFNNLLTVINGHASLLLAEGELDEFHRDCVRQIAEAATSASHLTRQLLALSRRQPLDPQPVELNAVVGSMTKMLNRIIGADISLQLQLEKNSPLILADIGMIEQVILNLALNGRDAMPNGGKLAIETRTVHLAPSNTLPGIGAYPGDFVRLTVEDTGVGIPAEVLPRIFDPFFTTKDATKGTGLELATVHSIVKQHQGWINVRSDQGKGSIFQLYLPITETKMAVAQPEAQLNASLSGRETILVTEDELTLRNTLKAVLERFGYRVLLAANGHEALGIWAEKSGEIDLLLTDMILPSGFSGMDLATRLLEANPCLRVIFTSGYTPENFKENPVLKMGDNFLPKPYAPRDLLTLIRRTLQNRSAVLK